MTYYWQFIQSRSASAKWWVIVTPYKEGYFLKSCPVGAGRVLFFMVEQVFLPMGEVWLTHNADTRCTVRRERSKGRENFLCLNLSCLALKTLILFHSVYNENIIILNIYQTSAICQALCLSNFLSKKLWGIGKEAESLLRLELCWSWGSLIDSVEERNCKDPEAKALKWSRERHVMDLKTVQAMLGTFLHVVCNLHNKPRYVVLGSFCRWRN